MGAVLGGRYRGRGFLLGERGEPYGLEVLDFGPAKPSGPAAILQRSGSGRPRGPGLDHFDDVRHGQRFFQPIGREIEPPQREGALR